MWKMAVFKNPVVVGGVGGIKWKTTLEFNNRHVFVQIKQIHNRFNVWNITYNTININILQVVIYLFYNYCSRIF